MDTKQETLPVVRELDLSGTWRAARLDPQHRTPDGPPATDALSFLDAVVPGAVQYDLVRAGELENPYGGTEAAFAAQWVSDSDWVYRTRFDADPAAAPRWALEFDGIDTFADVWLNGVHLGSTANAYRRYRFELSPGDLRAEGNELLVHVKAHGSMITDMIPEARERLGHTDGVEGKLGKSLIRRYQRSFFSGNSSLLNVGTGILGIGVHRPVRLLALGPVEVTDVFLRTLSLDEHLASVEVEVAVDTAGADPAGLTVEVELGGPDDAAVVVATAAVPLGGDGPERVRLEVPDPRPWWPRGYGDPTRYPLRVRVARGATVLAQAERQVGIRTVELREAEPSGRPTFQLVVNGTPLYVRGTNYIPVDYLKVHGGPADYRRFFELIVAGNNNLVRMWGGGAIESDDFYDECDRRGIMIWQDGYLHSNTYPDYDPDWVEEFRQESREMIVGMRRHPCLVVLCGGNEQREGWDEWQWKDQIDRFYGEKLITETIPELVAELEPGVPYVDNSPHGGAWSQSPVYGEGHIWGSFFNSYKDPLFVTETCWSLESYSRPETLEEVMGLDVDAFSGLGWTEKWTKHTGRPMLTKFPYTGYHNTGGLRPYLHGLELEQAFADHHALTNFRLHGSSCHGIVYWSFNKGGPLFQFGAVDYRLRPLMSHYFVARLFRDVVVDVYRDVDDVRVLASNASTRPVQAELELVHLTTAGEELGRWSASKEIPAGGLVRLLDLEGHYRTVVHRDREVAFARLTVDGEPVSDQILLFCPLVELVTPQAGLSVEPRRVADGDWELEIRTDGVSKLVQIEGTDGLILDDDYFPLVTGLPRTVRVRALERTGLPVTLRVSSLDDEVVQEVHLT